MQAGAAHEFETGQRGAEPSAGARQDFHGVIDAVQRQQRRAGRDRARVQLEGGSGDDAQRAFAADVQVAKVVAGVVLAQAAQAVPDLAFGGHDLQAQREIARVAIAQHLRAAGVGGQVAADGAAAFGRQAQREQAVRGRRGLLHGLQDAPGLHGDGVVVGVQRAHGGEPGGGQDDRGAGIVRRGAAAQARVAALRHHRHAMLGAHLDGGRHVGGRAGADHRQRRAAIAAAPIQHIGIRVRARQHVGVAQEGL